MRTGKKLTMSEAKQKAASFCAYQERCEEELRTKFSKWQLSRADQAALLEWLKEEQFLDEYRFAHSYASGKFRNNKWGRVKIEQYLRQKKVQPQAIAEALQAIEEDAYQAVLSALYQQKKHALEPNETDVFQLKAKLYRFLLGRGFEPELVNQQLAELS